ncbi:MAG: hypothetical protein Q8R29_00435, partial [bacterium]|nr:hypothetical protein [bacterium]
MFKKVSKNKKSFWSILSAGTVIIASFFIYQTFFTSQATASHFGGVSSWDTGCGGTVSVSKSASGSGTSPNGTISVTVSTNNVCTGIYWAVRLNAHAGPNTQYSDWLYAWGTGESKTFTFSNLSAGDYTVSGDAELQWWNGSTYVFWLKMSTTNGSVTISNPPPP